MKTTIASFGLLALAGPLLIAQSPPQGEPGSRAIPRADGAANEQRVDALLSKLTLEEKIELLGGVDGFFTREVARVGLPRFRMADGPMGVRNFGPATAMPGGIALAATWNPSLAERVGVEMGRDARAKGVHFLLGPGVNIYVSPTNGRNFEYYGEDPYLAGRIAVGLISGVQAQGVSATVKHFLGNNSEFDRHNVNAAIDERTLREIYLPAFEAAVREARVGAVMTSYNLVNGEHMSQNGHINNDLLKAEWGFDGLLMSDWTSVYDAVAAANGGLDLEMPSPLFLNRKNILPAVEGGMVTRATIDDKVRRLLRTAIRFGWLDREQVDPSIPRYNTKGREVALDAARQAIVLIKNDGPVLPLRRDGLRSIAVIGPAAYPAAPVAGGSARVQPFAATSVIEGVVRAFGSGQVFYSPGLPTLSDMAGSTRFFTGPAEGEPGLRVEYFDNEELKGTPAVTRVETRINLGPQSRATYPDGTLSDRWTGYYRAVSAGRYDVFVRAPGEDGGRYRLFVDETLVLDHWRNVTVADYKTLSFDAGPHKVVLEHHGRSRWLAPRLELGIFQEGHVVEPDARTLASRADAVIVAVGFDAETETEAADRTFRLPPGQDELIDAMLGANKNVIVVITSGGAVDARAWIDKTPALLQTWYAGQEGGIALGEILFGDIEPSGRLPITFERRWEDNPAHDSYYPEAGTTKVVYESGVFVGYRGYERNGTIPLFPFGHGLSYTSFQYSNLAILPIRDGATSSRGRARISVAFDVTNTGARGGVDVAQVYVADGHANVPRPPKELKGFSKVALRPGERRRVSVTLGDRAFAYFDVATRKWRIDPGEFTILVGRSSADIVLKGSVKVDGGS